MELTSGMGMARFQTFWIQMRKNKPLDERKLAKPQRRKWHFTKIDKNSKNNIINSSNYH
ncbi:hypothetical protein Hanom_Chr07g00663471 [Helianthus anomalus]